MIDYGNEESCPRCELRKVAMYTNTPSFSYKIRLYKVFAKNNKWDTADLDQLHNIFARKTIVAVFKEPHKPGKATLADVHTEDGLFINEYITEKSSNLSRKPFPKVSKVVVNDSDDDKDVIIEDEKVGNFL